MKVNEIYNEPCLDTLKKMPNDFLDCVITSPPYWQLRDYGYDGQWGLEPTFQEYLEHLWEMMDEIYRVLKPTGTCWINLGDTYGGGNSGKGGNTGKHTEENPNVKGTRFENGIKKPLNKCLLLIPHRFAIGCIDRGWIMRNDIIWAKRNGMPESCTDRFSKKHEFFFFMVKSEKYHFDLDAIRDKHKASSLNRIEYGWKSDHDSIGHIDTEKMGDRFCNPLGKNPGTISDFWDIPTKPSANEHYASYNDDLIRKPILAGCPEGGLIYDPFMGTGSTAQAAIRANRNFIGSEMSEKYIKICDMRLEPLLKQTKLF
jgi:DNA modification methylase